MRPVAIISAVLSLPLLFGGWLQVGSRSGPAARFYTQDQAKRGQGVFASSCEGCHAAGVGQTQGSGPVGRISLAGEDFIQQWYSVGDLYSKISMSMPADNVHGLTPDQYVNVVAYLLQQNGFPAGNHPLAQDVNGMKKLALRRNDAAANSPLKGISDRGYYTEAQADRGMAYFRGSCMLCHTADPTGPTVMKPGSARGVVLGSERRIFPLRGEQFGNRWGNVGNLYDKMHTTMPAYDAGGLTTQEYVDILAYILRANGLPAGNKELPADRALMKDITLEKGFVSLFNGTDLSGFKFLLGNNCAPRPEGCGQTEPGSTFQVEDGIIYCSGKPHGYMYTDKKYLNFTLRLEYRFDRYPDTESDDTFYGNSGYLLFITKHAVWPKMIEIQGQNYNVLSVIPVDSKAKFQVDDEARRRSLKPVGQWNSVEIVSKDGQVRSYLNGTLVSVISEHEFKEPGYIGFQSEGAQIYWRNVRIREE